MNTNAFSVGDLQNIRAFLQLCISEGATDIPAVTERLDRAFNARHKKVRMSDEAKQNAITKQLARKMEKEERKSLAPHEPGASCPECGSRRWFKDVDASDGTEFIECKNCRYSMMVG